MSDVQPRITIVGSFNTDLMSRTPRMPVLGETVLGGPFKLGPGGKGSNQAVAAARLGAEVSIIAKLGEDIFGDLALENLRREGIDTRYVARDENNHTGAALIIVDEEGENLIVVAPGANSLLSLEDVDKGREAISSADVLLLQLEIPVDTVQYAIELAHAHNVKVLLNPAPGQQLSEALLSKVNVLTPNKTEASILTGIEVCDDRTRERAAHKLLDMGVEAVVFTLGDEGALLVTPKGTRHVPVKKVKVVDTTGAGDAFNGALAIAIAEGKELIEAINFANHTAALSVTKVGTAPAMPTRADVEAFMKQEQER